MQGCLKFIRWIFSIFSLLLLFVLLNTSVIVTTLSINITNPEKPLAWLKNGGFYQNVVPIALSQLESQYAGDAPELAKLLQSEEVQILADEVLTPEWLESKFTLVVNAVYKWLDGSTSKPLFVLDITDKLPQLQIILKKNLSNKFKELETCTKGELEEMELTEEINPFALQCKPPGLDVDKEVDGFIDEMFANQEFKKHLRFDSSTLILDPKVQQRAPQIYSYIKASPYIAAAITLLLILLILIATPSKKFATAAISIILILTSTIHLLFQSQFQKLFNFFYLKITAEVPQEQILAVNRLAKPVLVEVFSSLARSITTISIALLVAALLLIVVPLFYTWAIQTKKNGSAKATSIAA